MGIVLKLIFVVFIAISLFSCSQENRDKRLDYIQGEWVFDSSNLLNTEGIAISRPRNTSGFLFRGDSCDILLRIEALKTRYVCDGATPGYTTHFKINSDTLNVWFKESEKYEPFLIRSLSKDTMKLVSSTGHYIDYIRPCIKSDYENTFDEIIIEKSFSGEGFECNREFFFLNKEGVFLCKSSDSEQIHSYRIGYSLLGSLFSNFKYLDINNLFAEYITGASSSYVIYYEITFVKDKKIVKKVFDRLIVSPDELLRGYIPIVFLRDRLADGGIKEWDGEVDMERIKRLWKE